MKPLVVSWIALPLSTCLIHTCKDRTRLVEWFWIRVVFFPGIYEQHFLCHHHLPVLELRVCFKLAAIYKMLHKLFLHSQITSTIISHNTIKVLLPSAGYLCVHVEKDESLGTTLILTWVPNSRIQRQDEEALRYITPESSPVRRNARRRGRRYKNVLLKMCL